MVCEKCEKKLGVVIIPDKWKDGARNTTESGRVILSKFAVLETVNDTLLIV